MRSWTQPLLLLLAVALAGGGGAGLVLWLQGRKSPPTPAVQQPLPLSSPLSEPAAAPTPVPSQKTETPSSEDVLAKALPAVVLVESSSGRGSAFFVARDRLITNHHVVAGQSYVKLRLASGQYLTALIAATAPEYDLALLRLMEPGPERAFLPLGQVQAVRQGQEVFAIGTPMGVFQNTVTRGIVSSLRKLDRVVVIQTDTALNPGNSGGPLIDHAGRVVGITTMGFRGSQGLNFAVAADHAQALLDGRPLGLAFEPAAAAEDLKGILGVKASEADQAREEGSKRYAGRLAAIARAADHLESAFSTFLVQGWEGKVVGRFERNFYALWEPQAMTGKPVQGYESQVKEMRQAADLLRAQFREAEEGARRADVFPGHRRTLRQTYRLEYPGWE